MSGRLLVVTGTGTEIGKTHLAEALLLRLARTGLRVFGAKPIESGVGVGRSDADRLASASSFHVKHPRLALRAPVSPHLAARREHTHVDLPVLAAGLLDARNGIDLLLVELPGGLFTPLDDDALNVDFLRLLPCDDVLLVAPDRLGVLHDVLATTHAAPDLAFSGIVLVAPSLPDASTGTNADELRRFTGIRVLATVPRALPAELALYPAVDAIVRALRLARRDLDPT
ncbi:MAG TPA: dethiobiotin synthase [Polyangiaceae bacterium]|jgi:dethiobiotin synthetase